ncbi:MULTISPECIES: hypothetical protein [unclassified Leifsonia]|uniref:hypothetical protein n=1 Tax=unclassified Leifsonia TaxID=2663824 RepID=UPI00039D0FED|nr:MULTISPECIES: hypothetical protein [unclassified Leifsonia]TDP98943.1 hypothetical protein AXZ95_2848 [Leifsonia sp. 115AMFTsu3.1]
MSHPAATVSEPPALSPVWYYARLSRTPEPPVRARAYRHRVARRASLFTARSPQSR